MWAVTHHQNYQFGAPFKIITDHKALVCLSEEKISIITQTRLVCWIDRLLPFDYKIDQIPGKRMALGESLPRHPVGDAAEISHLKIFFLWRK